MVSERLDKFGHTPGAWPLSASFPKCLLLVAWVFFNRCWATMLEVSTRSTNVQATNQVRQTQHGILKKLDCPISAIDLSYHGIIFLVFLATCSSTKLRRSRRFILQQPWILLLSSWWSDKCQRRNANAIFAVRISTVCHVFHVAIQWIISRGTQLRMAASQSSSWGTKHIWSLEQAT